MATVALGRRAGTLACVVAGSAALIACAATPAAPRNGPPVAAVWQRHRTMINYYGLTTLYSCDSLADKVRMLLLYLGARPGLTVQMAGCDRGFDTPGHYAAVNADFYTLVPANAPLPANGAASDSVAAYWNPVTVKPMVPYWMGYGECELMQQLKPLVTADFSARGLDYRTACLPYDVTVSDYDLNGKFLKPPASH